MVPPVVVGAASLAANVAAGIGVVLANKAVFTSAKFVFPVALTAFHYVVNYLLLMVLDARGVVQWRADLGDDRWRVRCMTAVWALHNGLSNLSLQRNSVGLYQVAQARLGKPEPVLATHRPG